MATNSSPKSANVANAEILLNEQAATSPIVGGTTNDGKREVKKKYWHISDVKNGHTLEFFPVFLVNPENGEVECRNLEMVFTDQSGTKHEMLFDWMNIYMFVYFTANEELRQQLATRYERKVNYVPYDVTIPVKKEDYEARSLKRRIELPIDELTMAIAREEAWKILMKNQGHWNDPSFFRYKK